jgi:hypothetical protein
MSGDQRTIVAGTGDQTLCENAAHIIGSMRGHHNSELVWPELGCSFESKCMFKNDQIVDQWRGFGLGTFVCEFLGITLVSWTFLYPALYSSHCSNTAAFGIVARARDVIQIGLKLCDG